MRKKQDLITRILAYLKNDSARWVKSTEMALVLFNIMDQAHIGRYRTRIQREINKHKTTLLENGVVIESKQNIGYRLVQRDERANKLSIRAKWKAKHNGTSISQD